MELVLVVFAGAIALLVAAGATWFVLARDGERRAGRDGDGERSPLDLSGLPPALVQRAARVAALADGLGGPGADRLGLALDDRITARQIGDTFLPRAVAAWRGQPDRPERDRLLDDQLQRMEAGLDAITAARHADAADDAAALDRFLARRLPDRPERGTARSTDGIQRTSSDLPQTPTTQS